MSRTVSIDEMADAINEGLKEYATLASTEVKKAVRKSAKRSKTRFRLMHRQERAHTKEAGWRPNSRNLARASRWWCIPRTATSWRICWKKVMPSVVVAGWQEDRILLLQNRLVLSSSNP